MGGLFAGSREMLVGGHVRVGHVGLALLLLLAAAVHAGSDGAAGDHAADQALDHAHMDQKAADVDPHILRMRVAPTNVVDGMTRNLTISCQTAPESELVVLSLVISHNGEPVASVSNRSPPEAMRSALHGFHNTTVSGHVEGPIGNIEMKVENPKQVETGTYSCLLSGVRRGHVVVLTAEAKVAFSSPSVGALARRIEDITDELDFASSPDLESELKTLKKDVAAMKAKANSVVLFSGAVTRKTVAVAGAMVRWDHVVANLGGGYDAEHGTFTAPTTGIYRMDMSVEGAAGQDMTLELRAEGDVWASVTSKGGEAAARSVVLRLRQDDVASVAATSQGLLMGRVNKAAVTFSVHMLAALD